MSEVNHKKKKIIFLITGSNTGGAEIVVKNLIFNIDLEKFLPIMVSLRPIGIIGKEIEKKFRVVSLGAEKKFNPVFLFRLFNFIKTERPDILHCHLFHANLLGRIIGKMLKVPLIISTIHSDNFGGKLRYFLLKITDPLTDINVVVSQKIKDDLVSKRISSKNKIKVIYNGVKEKNELDKPDIDKIKKYLLLKDDYPIILSIGRLNKIKGHIYLIRAIEILKAKYPKLKLLLIGDGPEKNELIKESEKLGLNKNILFLGEIRNTTGYYKLADIYVLPSLNEGFGLTVVEAMSNKLLVVASETGGVPEIIEDGISGFMAKPGNYKDLAKIIDTVLMLDRQKKEEITNSAYKIFKDNFSLDIMMKKYYSIYN